MVIFFLFFFCQSLLTRIQFYCWQTEDGWLKKKERQIFALFSVSNRLEKCFPGQRIKDFASQCKKKQVKISSRARVVSKKKKKSDLRNDCYVLTKHNSANTTCAPLALPLCRPTMQKWNCEELTRKVFFSLLQHAWQSTRAATERIGLFGVFSEGILRTTLSRRQWEKLLTMFVRHEGLILHRTVCVFRNIKSEAGTNIGKRTMRTMQPNRITWQRIRNLTLHFPEQCL